MDQSVIDQINIRIIKDMHKFNQEKDTATRSITLLDLIIQILENEKFSDPQAASQIISDICKKLTMKSSLDQMILFNIKFRLKKIISEMQSDDPSNQNPIFTEPDSSRKISQQMENRLMSTSNSDSELEYANTSPKMKSNVAVLSKYTNNGYDASENGQKILQHIKNEVNDLKYEIQNQNISILDQVQDILSETDTIFVYGYSFGVQTMILEQVNKFPEHKITIFISYCEGIGQQLYDNLISQNESLIKHIFLIEDVSADIQLGKCSKVILTCRAVLKNGNIICPAGANTVAVCANMQAIPIIVLTVSLKFALTDNPNKLIEQGNPLEQLSQDQLSACDCTIPLQDCVDASLISLYLTDLGAYPSNYIPNLFNEIQGKNYNDQK